MNIVIRRLATNLGIVLRSPLYIVFNYLNFKVQNVKYEKLPKIVGFVTVMNRGEIQIGSNVRINSGLIANPVGHGNRTSLYCLPSAKISIGNCVALSNTLIYSQIQITVEDNVMIGGGTQIWDTDFHPTEMNERIINNKLKTKTKAVNIKRGSFIGANTIILKGVTIGENSVVGAASVVTQNIPDNEVWAGNPAKYIKRI